MPLAKSNKAQKHALSMIGYEAKKRKVPKKINIPNLLYKNRILMPMKDKIEGSLSACERNERSENKAEMAEIYDDVTVRQ